MKVNLKLIKARKTKKKWRYSSAFEDGMTYHYFFNKKTGEFNRYNMTSEGLNSFYINNGRFPLDSELTKVDELSIEEIRKTFAKELSLT